MSAPTRLVLDTNVVIDWLVFDDPYMGPLRQAVLAGTVVVLTHELARAEFARVLAYPALKLTAERREDAFSRYSVQTSIEVMPENFALNAWQLPATFPRCRDRDDDLFLALAHHTRATALVTRDKALLKMRKRMRKFSLAIWDVQQLIAALG
jgi:uncharacterized protein